ncbi:receptor (calcitonin) activity modifying protein 2 [Cricetulus griseus]
MARFLVERAPGGSRFAMTRAGRPAALRLPPLLLLLLLLGGERSVGGPGGRRGRPPAAPRHYSDLQNCLEYHADRFGLGFPNPLAERIFFETHLIHFTNCSLVQPTFSDPPEDVLLAMIIAPICLIPFLVTLVVWRSKDSDAQA